MPLLGLPNEMLVSIAEHLPSEKHIFHFAQTNRRIYSTTINYLYRFDALYSECSGLVWVAKNGIEHVQEYFKNSCNIVVPGSVLQNAFSAAVESGHEEIITLLIEHGANVNHISREDGSHPLHTAIQKGHVRVVKKLLEHGADIQSQTHCGNARHTAADSGSIEILCILGIDKQNVDEQNGSGRTMLSWAAQSGHDDMVKFLLEHGADIAIKDRWYSSPLECAISAFRWEGWRPYHRTMKVLLCHENQLGIAVPKKKILEYVVKQKWLKTLDILLYYDEAKSTGQEGLLQKSLETCMVVNGLKMAKILVQKGANITAPDEDGWTPIHNAVWKGHLDLVECLISIGAHVDLKTTFDSETCLHIAARFRHYPVLRLLLQYGADYSALDDCNRSALFNASSEGQTDSVRLLLEKGADPNDGKSSLFEAAGKGHFEVVKMLLGEDASALSSWPQANVDPERSDGMTPLTTAAMHGHTGIVNILLQHGDNVLAADSRTGETALEFAILLKHEEICKALLDAGAVAGTDAGTDARIGDLIRKGKPWTRLYRAVLHAEDEIVDLLFEQYVPVDVHCEPTRCVCQKCVRTTKLEAAMLQMSTTPLLAAISKGYRGLTKCLLEYGANPNIEAKGHYGLSPLCVAAKMGKVSIVRDLILYGAVIDGGLMDKKSPLQIAAAEGHHKIVECLLEHRANTGPNADGITALKFAEDGSHTKAVEMLMRHAPIPDSVS